MKFIVHLPWQYFTDVAKVMPRFREDINGNDQAGAMRLCFANHRCWLAYARFASVRDARILARGEKVMQVSKDSIDLGIVVTDEKAALGFYRDLLGLEWEGELAVPGGRMYRLKCGTTVIKLLKLDRTPEAKPAPGGPAGGLGLRYFTISVPDIRGLMAQLEAKGVRPTVSVREARPGVTIAMVTDPDGNTVEFLQNTASR
jgi:catechol 2,3-dioxygenase-like lactoylglutathione lyase family enzyme